MRPRPLALLTAFALAGGLGACGGDDEFSTATPKSTPDLTIPTATSDTPPAQRSSGTTATSTTSSTPAGSAPPPAAAQPSAVPPPAAADGSATTGGQAPQSQSTTGGAQAGGGEFNDFCAQNPGVACDQKPPG